MALDDVEAVSICTPPFNHAEIAVASLRAGKHVYLEKPPAMNEAEMQFITDVAWQTGQIMLVGSNGVYHNEIQLLKRAIDRGELGEIYLIECLTTSRRRLPMGWLRVKALAGGGIGFDSTTHTLDHLLYLLGSPKPVSVTGRTYRHFADHPSRSAYTHMDVEEGRWDEVPVMETEDTLVAMVQFENGASLLLKDCYAANMPDVRSFRLYGTEAGARLHAPFDEPTHGDESPTTNPNPLVVGAFSAVPRLHAPFDEQTHGDESPTTNLNPFVVGAFSAVAPLPTTFNEPTHGDKSPTTNLNPLVVGAFSAVAPLARTLRRTNPRR